MQQEQIDGGGDTAAAVAHDTLVLGNTLRFEFGLGVGKRGEALALRIDLGRGRHIDAARDAAGPAIATGL